MSSRTPDGRLPLEGYADEISAAPGETCRFMLSGDGDVAIAVRRLVQGDPNPLGPGVKEEAVDWGQAARQRLVEQVADFGSFVELPAPSPEASFSLALWFLPTALGRTWRTLAVKGGDGDFSYGLFAGGHRLLIGGVGIDKRRPEWVAGRDYVQPGAWQLAVLSYSDAGELRLYQAPPSGSRHFAGDVLAAGRTLAAGGSVHASDRPLLLGASASPGGTHRGHFDGRIARPLLLGAALDAAAVAALHGGAEPASLAPVLGSWDLSRDVTTTRVVDVSGAGNHGRAVNAPARAVTGPGWDGGVADVYERRPADYDAIHLHEDDLEDAGWEPSIALRVPETARSGIYCLSVTSSRDRLDLPFVVRPRAASAPLCVVAPTLTWQAYSSNAFPWSHTEDGAIDRGVCVYMPHSDGSMVYYVTRRKPTRSGSPSAGYRTWGAHTVTSSLYLVDWLERQGLAYDVVCDEDLHHGGAALLSPYRCVVLGSHAEYWTQAMLEALRSYLSSGGRAAYLGGNGLYWVTSIDPRRRHLIEVRKSGEGEFDERWIVPAPGESQHSTTLEIGGTWARRGWPARALVGVEHASNVFEDAAGRWGFRRLDASRDERFAWVFDGVADETIGDFGLNLGSAAGYEMDAALDWDWGDATERVVLGRAEHELFTGPKRLPARTPAAEVVLTLFPGGGAVFAAGSITWTGSLSWNGYTNNVSRTTANVLRRFLETPAGQPVA